VAEVLVGGVREGRLDALVYGCARASGCVQLPVAVSYYVNPDLVRRVPVATP
jgi:hypothetical protein